ncbi:DNA binding protein [Phytophthora megakarya]|uniref:DNA binding protein n=1 Tax=Phytophthora megakarya TaxID=4795 RepID=A0A225W074_9STRA|nr:DNA binding protein [Phytophthora megakarya]
MSVNGYGSSMRYEQETNDARPKLYQPLSSDYNQLMHQQQHNAVKYEPGAPFYPPSALQVSSDYQSTPSTPSSAAKRSREELNLKEKQRMFKLNDRINQLKDILDDAGVQTKKNKQSILDNTSHYIEMLRGNLMVAQQKAERAEKQAEVFRAQTHKGGNTVDKVVTGVFEKTTTPRVVVDMDLKTVMFNSAFAKFTGLSDLALKKKKTLRPYLCADQDKLDAVMKKLQETKRSMSVMVKAATTKKEVSVTLIAAVVTDDKGRPTNVEFSLIPMETLQRPPAPKRQKTRAGAKDSKTDKAKESAIYVQL